MFRKIAIASILTLGLAIPLAIASPASAHPWNYRRPVFVPSITVGFGPVVVSPIPIVVTPTYARYLVQYRSNPGMPWITAGSYASRCRPRSLPRISGPAATKHSFADTEKRSYREGHQEHKERHQGRSDLVAFLCALGGRLWPDGQMGNSLKAKPTTTPPVFQSAPGPLTGGNCRPDKLKGRLGIESQFRGPRGGPFPRALQKTSMSLNSILS